MIKQFCLAVFATILPCFGEIVVSVNEGESARAAIQKAIDTLPPSGGSIFLPAGKYKLDGMVHINRSYVSIRGEQGTILVLKDGVKQPNILIGSDAQKPDPKKKISHVTISNLELDGNKDKQDSEFHPTKPWLRNNTIDIRGVDDLRIENVDAHHARSGGIVASWDCERIWIRGSAFHHHFFDGIALYTSDGIIVSDFYCYENNSAGVSLDNKLMNVTFTNGHIYKNKDCGVFARDCIAVNFRNILFRDNGDHGAFLAHQVYPKGHPKQDEIVPDSGMIDCVFTSCSFIKNGGYGVCFSSNPEMSKGNAMIGCILSHNEKEAVSLVEDGFFIRSGNVEIQNNRSNLHKKKKKSAEGEKLTDNEPTKAELHKKRGEAKKKEVESQ